MHQRPISCICYLQIFTFLSKYLKFCLAHKQKTLFYFYIVYFKIIHFKYYKLRSTRSSVQKYFRFISLYCIVN